MYDFVLPEQLPTVDQLGLALFNDGALKFGKFVLNKHRGMENPPTSPIYFSLRPKEIDNGPLSPKTLGMIGYMLYCECRSYGIEYDAVAGLPRAGDPIAEAFAAAAAALDHKKIPVMKLHKSGDKVNGSVIDAIADDAGVPEGSQVLVLDDLVTEATTKRQGIKVVEDGGYRVAGIGLGMDRQQGGAEELEALGYCVIALTTMFYLIDLYVERQLIDPTRRQEVLDYTKQST